MKRSEVIATTDTNYKDGNVSCSCGWSKEFGDGFNQYKIEHCPECCSELETRNQRKVTTGTPGRKKGLTVSIGRHTYFVLSNGIHVQFSKTVSRTHHVFTESQADRL